MIATSRFGILFSLLLILGVLVAGCSDQSPVTTPVPTTALQEKYFPGDIIARTSSSTDTMLFVITDYDRSADQYTRRLLYKNSDGSWGHFVTNVSEKAPRSLVESVYPVKIAHVQISSIPVVTPTVSVTVSVTPSGNAPAISGVSPVYGGSGATVSATISGSNFQNGATVRLTRAGVPSIFASGVSTSSSTEIKCTFRFSNAEKGIYNLVVTNPDGQSNTLPAAFTIGDVPPIIGGVSPGEATLNETLSITVSGQNFKEGVRVSLLKSSSEIICTSPVSTESTKIVCNLDLRTINGASAGDWDVTVLNIEGQQTATWNQKFRITGST